MHTYDFARTVMMLGLGQAFMPAQLSRLPITEYAMVHAAADVSTYTGQLRPIHMQT